MKKILVVDNDELILAFMTDILSKEGYQVVTAGGGLAAVEILKQNTPDVIFVDLVMPDIDGRKLCKIIRGMDNLRDAYVVILSAALTEEALNIAELGADACIAKGPFNQMAENILWVLDQPDLAASQCLSEEVIGKEGVYPRELTKELIFINTHFEGILDRISDGILEITSDGKIVYVNARALFLISIPEEKLLGSYFVELFAVNDRRRVSELIKTKSHRPKGIIADVPVNLHGRHLMLSILRQSDERFSNIIVMNDVTEQRKSEEKLRANEARFQTIIQEDSDGIVITNRDGIIRFTNPAATALLARKEEELMGESFGFPVVPGETAELDIIRKDGKNAMAEMRVSEMEWEGETVCLASLRDITEIFETRKRAVLLSNLIENAQLDMMFVTDFDGRIMECNALATKALGYSGREILGQNIESLFSSGVSDEWQEATVSIEQESRWQGDLQAICKDGRTFPVQITISRHVDDTNMICFVRDITKEKEIDRMKSEFVSIVGHELRTPLTSIKNAVNILLSEKAGVINENQKKFLSMADRNIVRLSAIINDLLDISKIESGRIRIELRPLELGGCLDAAIVSLRSMAQEKAISINKEIPSDLPLAYGDLGKIEQIFINLIENAIKFTPTGGHIYVSAIAHELNGDFIRVSVADTGICINPDELEKIFDRFYQVGKSLTRETKGTGLGLSIVKGLVEAHGGKIWAESKEGKGTEFIFTLPVYSPERYLTNCVDKKILEATEENTPVSLMALKINEFEHLIEVFGESEATKLLDEVKCFVQDAARKTTDILETQTGGRVIMILADTSKEGAFALSNRIKGMISKHAFAVRKKPVKVDLISGGVATYPEDGVTGDELIKKAQG